MAVDRILLVDDEADLRNLLEEFLVGQGFRVTTAGTVGEAEGALARHTFDLALIDLRLPDGEGTELVAPLQAQSPGALAIIMTGHGSVESAVACMKEGAFDYIIKPFRLSQIEIVVGKATHYRHLLNLQGHFLREEAGDSEILGRSEPIKRLRAAIAQVAPTEATVLIQGESGTGKELIASEIHRGSRRAEQPFIKVNCAAIAENLIESEFFGHEKGAFTGAVQRRLGRFELADGGTILLDEVSEISPPLQAKLLRVLQEREFERVGGTKTLRVDVRVLATTNRDLQAEVHAGRFREDLYYRLNVFPLQNPPLRSRREDIPLLAERFLQRACRQHGLTVQGFSRDTLAALVNHAWPGNVRELQNTIERGLIFSRGRDWIEPDALGLPAPKNGSNGFAHAQSDVLALEEVERAHILEVLRANDGNRTHAARQLRIGLRTLRNKINRYRDLGIEVPEPNGSGEAVRL